MFRRSRTSSGQVLQHAHHVRAGLPLQDQAGDEELQIDERDALAQVVQRVFERRAEGQFLHQLLEFHLHRIAGLGGDGFEAAVNVVAGAHGTGEQVDGVGKLIFEFAQALGARHAGYRRSESQPMKHGKQQAQEKQLHAEQPNKQKEADRQRQRHETEPRRRRGI